MKNGHMSELSQKISPDPRWAKTSIFSIFWKVFENEENPRILTPGQVKYTNSFIWMENGHMSELSLKISPNLLWAKTWIFSIFWKVFENEEYPHILTTGQLKYTNSLIWMENGHMSELSQKSSPSPRWAKISIFSIFWKVFENEENPSILTPGQLKYTNSFIWMENGHMTELSLKISSNPRWAKTWICSIFLKVFENEEYPHILTPGQLKYTNSLIWMQNGHMSELSQKSSPGPQWAKISIFSIFLKSFQEWRISSYSHSRTSKIYKFIHLDGKWAHEWIEPKKFPRSAVGENFIFFYFLKSFRKWRKSSYSHSRTTKIYKFTHSDGKLAHERIEQKKFPWSAVGKNFFWFFEKFSDMKKILIFSLQDNYNIQIHSFGWKMGTWVNWAKKVSQIRGGRILQFFRFFFKVFENEENPQILTPGLLKYTNSLIWMENGHMRELSQKSFPGPRWAKTSIFSIFWKFSKMKNILIFSLQDK